MNKPCKTLFFLLAPFIAFSQTTERQESEEALFSQFLYETLITASENLPKALHSADSAYIYSPAPARKARALMLSATILEREERKIEAIEYASKSLEITKELKDYSFEARIYGFLSTQNRNIGFYSEGEHYLKKGMEVIHKLKDRNKVERYLAMANHELAEYAMEKQDYINAIQYIDQALISYSKEEDENLRHFISSSALQLKARSLTELNKREEALQTFHQATQAIKEAKAEHSLHAGLIFQGLGDFYLNEQKIDSAGFYLLKSLEITEPANNDMLKELLYTSLISYYNTTGDLEKQSEFRKKQERLLQESQKRTKQNINHLYTLSRKNKNKMSNHPLDTTAIISLLIFIIAGSTGILFFRKTKKLTKPNTVKKSALKNSEQNNFLSKNAEIQIQEKLENFVKSRKYLDKNLSFPQLTTILNTNAKYLNHFLRTHHNKDYTAYINGLRINYIVERLKNNKAYRNYKISYLAEEAGFSSPSAFSANFKKITGFSPNEYIKDLNQ